MNRWMNLMLSMALLGLLAGCASTPYGQGKKLLAQQDYAGAVKALETALAQTPDDVRILVELARALYFQNELDRALTYLEKARSLDPDNSDAVLLQGLTYEKMGDRPAAIRAYQSYTQLSRLSRVRRIIQARLDWLIRQQIQQDVKQTLTRESRLDVASIPDNALAVAPFRNLGGNATLDPLQKGLAEMMITDLSKVNALQVVERLRMQAMMQEIGLGMTGLVDEATAPRLGKLLGASRVVNGSFADLAGEQLRLDLSVAGVKSGDVEASEAAGPLEKLFRLQKELTFGIVAEMGIELTDAERDAIQVIPTENLLAFIAYSKGVDLEDRGEMAAAAAAFQEAAELDPQFAAAQEGVERMEGASLGAESVGAVEAEVFAAAGSEEAGRKGETRNRLAATGAYAGAGFIPVGEGGESEVREPLEEQEDVDFGGEGVEMEVTVPLPQGGRLEVTGSFEE